MSDAAAGSLRRSAERIFSSACQWPGNLAPTLSVPCGLILLFLRSQTQSPRLCPKRPWPPERPSSQRAASTIPTSAIMCWRFRPHAGSNRYPSEAAQSGRLSCGGPFHSSRNRRRCPRLQFDSTVASFAYALSERGGGHGAGHHWTGPRRRDPGRGGVADNTRLLRQLVAERQSFLKPRPGLGKR